MEWYRNQIWNNEIELIFEEKLRKSRTSYNKAEYLRIQGGTLLSSEDDNMRQIGLRLLDRVYRNYPNEASSSASSLEVLAEYYTSIGDLQNAESCYLKVLEFYKTDRNATSGTSEINLAGIYLINKDISNLKLAYKLLADNYNEMEDYLILDEDRFEYYKTLAFVSKEIGKDIDAKENAKYALEIIENENQFTIKFEKSKLQDIINQLKSI